MLDRFTNRFMGSVCLMFVVFSSSLAAQSLPAATLPADGATQTAQVTGLDEKPLPLLNKDDVFSKGFAHQLLRDQKSIWTSPARIKGSDVKWLAPLAAGTAFLFTKDNQIAQHFEEHTSLLNTSNKISNVGLYSTWAVPGAFLALGKFGGNERMSETGTRGFQAAIYSTAVMQAMKLITDRARPGDGGNGHFWTGGDAFPSGHSMEAWALAKVVSDEYSDKPLVKIGMYSFATAVSLSRIGADRHWSSDVLVGGAVGYMIGKFVMRDHHAQAQ
jgi:membrane-associated phospholipid phosphatase